MKKETYEKEHKRIIFALIVTEENNEFNEHERLTRELLELENEYYGE